MSKNLIKLMCGLCIFYLLEGGIVYWIKNYAHNSPSAGLGAGLLQWLLTIILLIVSSIVVFRTQKAKYNCIPITLALGMALFLYYSWLPDLIREAHTLMGIMYLLIFIGMIFMQIFYALKNSILGSFLTFALSSIFLLLYASYLMYL